MKIVELNRTHKLYYYGFTHGLRFDYMNMKVRNLISDIGQRFGPPGDKWTHYRSRKGRPIWVGFKDPKVISFVLML